MNLKGEFGIVQKPTVEKLYSTEEIALLLDCTTAIIRNIVSYYHISCEKVIKHKSARRAMYSYEAYKLIKNYRENKRKYKTMPVMTDSNFEGVTAFEDHSLVTDKRCLDLNYWPDVIPDCFKECEE